MLQRVEAEVGQVGGLGMPEDAEDAALVFELVQHGIAISRSHCGADIACSLSGRLPRARLEISAKRRRPRLLGLRDAPVDDRRSADRDPDPRSRRSLPIACAGTPAWRRAAEALAASWSADTTTRDADSPKSVASRTRSTAAASATSTVEADAAGVEAHSRPA